ncbi:MAG: VOC family protein [Brevinema sp.]
MAINIKGIDHIVITVGDIDTSIAWYRDILGMRIIQNGTRFEAHFGSQKINFHAYGGEFQPAAHCPTEGSVDIALELEGSIEDALVFLCQQQVDILLGPVLRMGARGEMQSIYLRDPDQNLIELSAY